MTVYNREDFVEESIKSVLNQTIKDLELIIVDDASIDNSREIIEKYKEKDKRIKVLFHKKNMGIAKSTNDGINLANGKFLAFIDSDDLWVEKKLEKQLKILKEDDNFVVWTNGEFIDHSGDSLGVNFIQYHKFFNRKKSGNIFRELLKGNIINKPSLLFKKENLGNIRFDENLKTRSDYPFAVHLSKKNKFYFIEDNLTKIRRHEGNISKIDKKIIFIDYISVYNNILEKYGKEISVKSKMFIHNKIINLSIKLSDNLQRLPRGLGIDIYKYIFNLKDDGNFKKELIRNHNGRIDWVLYQLYRSSYKSFILGLAIILKFKKIKTSIRFWLNLLVFFYLKLIIKK